MAVWQIWVSVFLFHINSVIAQPTWQLNRNENGIKVFTAKEGASKFKSIKVEALMDGSIESLLAILMNVDNNKTWVYKTKRSYLVKKINDKQIIYYAETDMPAPLSNRDVVIHMNFYPEFAKGTLTIKAYGISEIIPAKDNIVRIPYFKAEWFVKYNSNNKLDITYYLKADPGGHIPAFVGNMFIGKGPFETFSNLSQLLKNK